MRCGSTGSSDTLLHLPEIGSVINNSLGTTAPRHSLMPEVGGVEGSDRKWAELTKTRGILRFGEAQLYFIFSNTRHSATVQFTSKNSCPWSKLTSRITPGQWKLIKNKEPRITEDLCTAVERLRNKQKFSKV